MTSPAGRTARSARHRRRCARPPVPSGRHPVRRVRHPVPCGTQPVAYLPDTGTHLTVCLTYRQPDRVPRELRLVERVHVDLARTASACCPDR
ncbi:MULTISPECIES: putative leader peptide [Streptomyces]|uniref:putative leader peptide n=1 Tax=Streptomyces TaxID=1883 RepID=UPI003570F7B7